MKRLAGLLLALLLAASPSGAQIIPRAAGHIASQGIIVRPVDVRLPQFATAPLPAMLTPSAIDAGLSLSLPKATQSPKASAAASPVVDQGRQKEVKASGATRIHSALGKPERARLLDHLSSVVPAVDGSLTATVTKLEKLYSERAGKDSGTAAEPSPVPPVEGLPIGWVRRQLGRNRNADPAVLKRQRKAQNSGFGKAALNPEVLALHNGRYTTQLPVGRVTNQQESGRCWIFAGLNMLRSMLIAQGKIRADFEFSQNYLYYFSQLERSNRYLEKVVKWAYATEKPALTPRRELETVSPRIGDAGKFAYFQFLVEKYGLVPKSAMPETKSSGATELLDRELNHSLGMTANELVADARHITKNGGASRAQEFKEQGMTRIMKILSAHLGTPPARLDYVPRTRRAPHARTQSYTPRRFSKEFVRFDFDDYAQVASRSYQRRGTSYEAEDSALGAPGAGGLPVNYRYLNVDMDRLEALAVAALEGGQPLYVYIAMGRDVNSKTGIMHPAVYDRAAVYGLSKSEEGKLTLAQSDALGLNTGDHLMVLTGFDRPDPDKPVVKFKVENSWGVKRGDRGVYHMYREWFREHLFNIIIHKSFLTAAELKAWKSKAKKLE